MSKFTDIFIKRPILATVISLFILMLGIIGISKLSIQEYPTLNSTTITITTVYPGANAETIQSFVTTPIEQFIASTQGIDYLTSTSTANTSIVTANLTLNYDGNKALTEITGQVSAAEQQLPADINKPVIAKTTGDDFPDLILSFSSDTLSPEAITAYLKTIVTPQIMAAGGVSNVMIMGDKSYAMRIWLDPHKMAEYDLSAYEIQQALLQKNIQSSAGKLKTPQHYIDVNAESTLESAQQFENLIIVNKRDHLVRIKDIGSVELGSSNYDLSVLFNNKPAVFTGVQVAPGANPLTVIGQIMKDLPQLEKTLLPGLKMETVYNRTTYIQLAINDVAKTITEAVIIVMLVILLFLGAFRSVFIPIVTIPLSLIGVCFLMLIMGFSINLLTLLAMVLAIGLVVDDAIVVLENIYRHLEEGMGSKDAAIHGAREITGPIIVMTLTLAAVFAPIGFIGGLSGALFKEFAFTLAGSVIISGIVALTFSPMLCSKMINRKVMQKPIVKKIDAIFDVFKNKYQRSLIWSLECRFMSIFAAIVIVICMLIMFFMVAMTDELAPDEDQGVLFLRSTGPTTVNLNYVLQYNQQLIDILNSHEQTQNVFMVNGFGASTSTIFTGMVLKPWDERTKTAMELVPPLQAQTKAITGIQTFVISPAALPGTPRGLPISFVLQSTSNYKTIYQQMNTIINKAKNSGNFLFIIGSLDFDNYQLNINIDREKAATLGVNIADITNNLSVLLSDNTINYFSMSGYNYAVIPQVLDSHRMKADQLNDIYLKTQDGQGPAIPLSSLVSFSYETQPKTLERFQQLNSATIMGMSMPGQTIAQALNYLNEIAQETLPPTTLVNYGGQSRQYMAEGNSLIYAFLTAIIVIYLLLAAQFESWRDPAIILSAVPLTIFAALLPMFFGFSTLNIYTKIGLITLIGLISKHGILMVDFANKIQQREGLSVHDAIVKSAALRLRPILMTTAAMVAGVVPLILATGAGAVSRNDIGMVVFSGMLIGTCFTLYILPTIYTYLAKDHSHDLE